MPLKLFLVGNGLGPKGLSGVGKALWSLGRLVSRRRVARRYCGCAVRRGRIRGLVALQSRL